MNTRPYNAAPILIKMAKEELDQDVRQEAIRTLGWLYSTQRGRQIPPRQTEVRDNVISVLAAVMDDSDLLVRHACIRALHDIGRPAAALSGRFVEMIKDPTQSQTQIDAADALRSVDPNGEAILRSLLPESEAGAQYAIIWALSSSNTPENRNAIRPFLKSDDPKLLVAALHTVARMRPWDDDVLNQIESMCSADDERTRAAAINAATMDADPERLQHILQRAEKDTSARVISAVRNAKRRLATTRPARNETAPKTPEP